MSLGFCDEKVSLMDHKLMERFANMAAEIEGWEYV